MKKIIAFLAKLGFWPFVILFTIFALIISELLIVLHSYWLTGVFFDKNLLIVGFTIPLIVGLTAFSLIALLIRSFQNLENEKDKIITLQKDTQDKLDTEKERALRYLDITGTLIVALDTDANIVLANKELCKALGYESEEDLLGKNWIEETIPFEDQIAIKESCSDVMRGNIEPYRTYETRFLQKDGTIKIIEWHNEHIKDSEGNIEGILSSGTDVTKSREDKEKLKKSASYQRALLDSFPFLIWLKDTKSNFLAVNKSFANAAGVQNTSELIGKNDLDYFPKDLADAYRADDKEVMKSLQKKELEELIEGHGERKWHQTYKAPILDKDGNLFGTVGFARDITQDKESEEELKLMKHALDNVKEAVYLTNKEGRFIYINDGAQRQLGYTKEELREMGISDIDPNFSKSKIPSHWKDVKDKGTVIVVSAHKHKNGTVFPIEVNANYVEYRDSEYILAFVKDITERKITEEKLNLSASVFTHTHEGILITDKDNVIIDVNEAFTTITGYPRAEVLGKKPNILKSGRNDKEFYSNFWKVLHKDGVWKGELWNRKKDGEEYVENAIISIIYDNDKNVQNYISLFTDITQEKLLQQKLEHSAYYDALTNLPNRVLFSDRMKQAISQAARKKKLIAVAYIDIDGFKQINDSYGHDIGDKLLVLLAEKMTNLLRKSDTISRVGGDEFIALFVDIENKKGVSHLLDRLIYTIAESTTIDGFPINVSASIGVTFYPQTDKLDADQIIRQADQAMYKAKSSGKNQYIIYDSGL